MNWQRTVAATIVTSAVWMAPAHATGQTFRGATELVNLNVAVLGAGGQPIDGLTPDQFEVFEDGVPQEVQFFASGAMPLDVAILLDTSSSMAGSMPMVRQAARRLIDALRPGDRATLMSVTTRLQVLQAMTDDLAAVDRAVVETEARGGTALYASVYTALHELARLRRVTVEAPRRQAVVVFSDGQDTASSFQFDDLLEQIRRAGLPIYVVAPRGPVRLREYREVTFGESSRQQDYELRKMAAETGASAYFPTSLDELAGVFDEIAAELARHYAIGYESSNPTRDGGFRRISLRVAGAGVSWRTRSGYFADAQRVTADESPCRD